MKTRSSHRPKSLGIRRGAKQASSGPLIPVRLGLGIIVIFMLIFYILTASILVSHSVKATTNQQNHIMVPESPDHQSVINKVRQMSSKDSSSSTPKQYSEWRDIAMQLASLTPDLTLKALEEDDPFGVRSFEQQLIEQESKKGAFLTQQELQLLFPCPRDRITLPEQRDMSRISDFQNQQSDSFLYFQHLRKAGGTNFCSLAQNNLPKESVYHYYCMPDYGWPRKHGACAGCLAEFSTQDINRLMREGGYKIAGNEWDAFDPERFFELNAVFATSFRKPIDRALSQFRFECIEDRGCKIKVIEEWWKIRKELYNVYTWSFTNQRSGEAISFSKETAKDRQHAVGYALDNLIQFHIVLSMEWLAYAEPLVESVFGFKETSALTTRVRPHIAQYKRDDGQTKNKMGAAGINKASWDPKTYLSADQYKRMSETLALDEILTEAARRIYLERLVCNDV